MPLLPHTPSWRGAQSKHMEKFTFTLTVRTLSDNVSVYGGNMFLISMKMFACLQPFSEKNKFEFSTGVKHGSFR
jgi:hypothetical protein